MKNLRATLYIGRAQAPMNICLNAFHNSTVTPVVIALPSHPLLPIPDELTRPLTLIVNERAYPLLAVHPV